MPEIKSSNIGRVTGISTLVVGILTAVTEILKATTSILGDHVPKFVEALDKVPAPVRWGAVAALLTVCLIAWYRTRPAPSRLLQPEKFDLDPDNRSHLKGRDGTIEDLRQCCREVRLVELTGESGSGKTALVRSGLVPSLRAMESPLYPLYLEFWGNDWVRGPQDALWAALQESLSAEERKALGLPDGLVPHDLDAVFQLLTSFQTKLRRQPLLIFDQFDDYQRLHRSKFLTRNGFWLKATTVAKNNPFWAAVQKALEAGTVHALFVTRSDMAEGLQSVRFWQPAAEVQNSLQLPRVEAQYLPALLDELAPAQPEKPVVENPDAGWVQLKDRLARDLTTDGFALPVQVLVAVRSLARLPDQTLTVGNYEREGGVEGLEARFVERAIRMCVQAQPDGGLTESCVLEMLSAMVDNTDSKLIKTHAMPLATLAGALRASEVVTSKVLVFLSQKSIGLVRMRGSTRECEWSLYHDYFARGVRAATRRARFWTEFLKERHQRFTESEHAPLLARWRTLLSPFQQVLLLWHRVRGRFQYGEHGRYAALSLVRFSSWALTLAVGLAVSWILFDESDRRASEVNAVGLMTQIGTATYDQLRSGDALQQLAASNQRTRRLFWKSCLAADENLSYGLANNAKMLFHASVGLDPDGHERTYLVDQILTPALNDVSGNPGRLLLIVGLFKSSQLTRNTISSNLFAQLVAALERASRLFGKRQLAFALRALPGELDADLAKRVFEDLVAALENATHPADKELLSEALEAVPGKLDPALASRAYKDLIAALERASDSQGKRSLASALRAVPAELDADLAKRAVEDLIAALKKVTSLHEREQLGEALQKVPGKLEPALASRAFKDLIAAIQSPDRPEDNDVLERALRAVAGMVSDPDRTSNDLIVALQKTTDSADKKWLGEALRAVVGRVSDPDRAFTDLVVAVEKATDPHDKQWFVKKMRAVPGKLNAILASRAFTELVAALEKTLDPFEKGRLSKAIGAVPGKLDAALARRAFTDLVAALEIATDPFNKEQFATALGEIPGKLDTDLASRAFKDLALALEKATDPTRKICLTKALEAVSANLNADLARRARNDLVAALEKVSNPLDKRALAFVLQAVPGELDANLANRAVEDLVAALKKVTNSDEREQLGEALRAVAGKLDPALASRAFKDLVTALEGASESRYKAILAFAVQAVPGKLDANLANRAVEDLIAALKKVTISHEREQLGEALRAVAGKLDPALVSRAFKDLVAALEGASETGHKAILASALKAVPGKLDADLASRAYKDLIAALERASDSHDKAQLAFALPAVPGKLDADLASRAYKDLIAALEMSTTRDEFEMLASALAAIPGKIDTKLASRAFSRLFVAFNPYGLNDFLSVETAKLAKALRHSPSSYIELLALPWCIGKARQVTLQALESCTGEAFVGDHFAAARWARDNGIVVPTRPK